MVNCCSRSRHGRLSARTGWQSETPSTDALQASYTKRFSRGLSVIAGYTWSKLMTDVANGTWAGTASVRSYYCVRCEHSPSTYDVPHRFTLSAVGELPFGKGKMFGHGWNRVVDAVLGGWQANGILTLASGQPLVFATASNNSYTFGGGQHPDVVGDPVLASGQEHLPVVQYRGVRAAGEFHIRQSWREPTPECARTRRKTSTSRCSRISSLKERYQIALRAETFNLTNTPVFGAPGTTVNGANFGIITGQSNVPRNVQLALKLIF